MQAQQNRCGLTIHAAARGKFGGRGFSDERLALLLLGLRGLVYRCSFTLGLLLGSQNLRQASRRNRRKNSTVVRLARKLDRLVLGRFAVVRCTIPTQLESSVYRF